VDEAGGVDGLDRPRQLGEEPAGPVDGEQRQDGRRGHPVAQVGTVDQLHHDRHGRPLGNEVEDPHHVGVVDPLEQVALAGEALHDHRVVVQLAVHELDGHVAAHTLVAGPVDDAARAVADRVLQLAGPDPRAGRQDRRRRRMVAGAVRGAGGRRGVEPIG
jgi:hypothetical protein